MARGLVLANFVVLVLSRRHDAHRNPVKLFNRLSSILESLRGFYSVLRKLYYLSLIRINYALLANLNIQ